MAQGSGKTPSCSQRGQLPAVSWEESLVNASFRELLRANLRGKSRAAPGSPSLYNKDRVQAVWGNCPCP